jgi:phosphatidylserine/phosphatidylglycerophosphate/cardiolipin synthase-like enzyme
MLGDVSIMIINYQKENADMPYRALVSTNEYSNVTPVLDELLSVQGNFLVMAYGYITYSDSIREDWIKIRNWLDSNHQNKLAIYIGVFCAENNNFSVLASSLISIFKNGIFPTEWFCNNKITINGVDNFHPKVMCIGNQKQTPGKGELEIVIGGAIVGSSNFTDASRYGDRLEFDLLLNSKNIADTNITDSFNELINKAKSCINYNFNDSLNQEIEKMRSKEAINKQKKEHDSRIDSWDTLEIGARNNGES